MRKKKNIIKKIIFVVIAIYVIMILANQQKTLSTYNKNSQELSEHITQETANKEELAKSKENINSLDYIEKMAREKLDMYLPNEKVYVDKGI